MFRDIDLEEFLRSDRSEITDKFLVGITLLTPYERADLAGVEELVDETGGHNYLFSEAIKRIFAIETDLDPEDPEYAEKLDQIVRSVVRNKEENFVNIRYMINKAFFLGIVSIPKYINTYQYENLVKLNELYNRIGMNVCVNATRYDPFTMKADPESKDKYFGEDATSTVALTEALEYMAKNDRIVDIDISFLGDTALEREGYSTI